MDSAQDKMSSLVVDNFDLYIITSLHGAFLEKRTCGTGEITRLFYKNNPNIKDSRFFTKKDNYVGQRMKRLERQGIIVKSVDEHKKNRYSLNYKNVTLKRCKFPDCVKSAVYIKDIEKRWTVFQL